MPDADPSNATQPPDERGQPLCPNCLAPNRVDAHFCSKCYAPLTVHAATDPMGSIFAYGHVISKAAARPQSRIVVLGMWLIFGSAFLMNLPALWITLLALIHPIYHFPGTSVPNYNFFLQRTLIPAMDVNPYESPAASSESSSVAPVKCGGQLTCLTSHWENPGLPAKAGVWCGVWCGTRIARLS